MVPLGTSKEALIHEITFKTEQPPADPDLVPVKFSVKSSRKGRILLATLVIVVVIVAVFVPIFVSKHIKNKEKEESLSKYAATKKITNRMGTKLRVRYEILSRNDTCT